MIFQLLEFTFLTLCESVEKFQRKLKIEDPQSIIQNMAIADDEEYRYSIRHELLTLIRDFVSEEESKVSGESAKILLELFLKLSQAQSDKYGFSILKDGNIQYLGIDQNLPLN